MEELNRDHKKREQLNAASFGLVAYAVKSYYKETKEENELLDMPVAIRAFLEAVERFFNEKLKNSAAKVKNILAGHEHGDDNGKAHFQCLVDLTTKGRIAKEPAELLVGDVTILIMFQQARNRKELVKYCQKEKRFEWLNENQISLVYKKNAKGEETEKVDVFATVFRNRDTMSKEDATDLIMSHDARTCFTSFKNIESAIKAVVTVERPKFEWCWPVHMDKVRYEFIYKWFNTYCIGNPERKKALLLYSKERGTGKTRFAKSLVSDVCYYVYFRNTFTSMPDDKDPRLLILDDMNYMGGGDKVEMWKALVAGEPTSIREAYVNYEWDFRVPCIITTNQRSLVKYLASSEMFKTQVMFYEVTEYIGPEGTRPEDIDKVEMMVSDELAGEIKAVEEARIEGKTRMIDVKGFIERAQLVQKVADLEEVIGKLKKKKQKTD
jgi:hypothetical protein